MDLDSDVNQNLDSVFDDYDLADGKVIWGQADNWNCEAPNTLAGKTFCSGMMLFKPDVKHLEGLKQRGADMKNCWGDQKLISSYFTERFGRTQKIFPKQVVTWAHCGGDHNRSMVSHIQRR